MDRRRFLKALGIAVPTVAFFDMGAAWAKGESPIWQSVAALRTELQLHKGGQLIMSADLSDVPGLMDSDELLVKWNSNGTLDLTPRQVANKALEQLFAEEGGTLEDKYEQHCLRAGASPEDARLWSTKTAQRYREGMLMPELADWVTADG